MKAGDSAVCKLIDRYCMIFTVIYNVTDDQSALCSIDLLVFGHIDKLLWFLVVFFITYTNNSCGSKEFSHVCVCECVCLSSA